MYDGLEQSLGLRPSIFHWFYVTMIRLMLSYVVWLQKNKNPNSQRLFGEVSKNDIHSAPSGSMRKNTPKASMEEILSILYH